MEDKTILYMLFSLEAKLRVQQDLLIEIADILTNKPPGDIKKEIALQTLAELKKIKEEAEKFAAL